MAVEYFHMAVRHNPSPEKTILHLKWYPHNAGFFKLNIDGAACETTREGKIGGVFRNNRGDWFMGYMRGMPHTTSIRAELQAL